VCSNKWRCRVFFLGGGGALDLNGGVALVRAVQVPRGAPPRGAIHGNRPRSHRRPIMVPSDTAAGLGGPVGQGVTGGWIGG